MPQGLMQSQLDRRRTGQAALGQDSISPQPDIEGTYASIDQVTVADVDRIIDPEWYTPYYEEWAATFGR